MTATKREIELQQEIEDLRSGRTFHRHTPRDGSTPFRCWSPYCEDLGESEPIGGPPNYLPAQKYRR